ncbi:MAG: hypothetical protein MK106_09510 [Mariniblastus sp.]|nr:hypothetical protein [Mariniblastus sp.]
MNVFYPAALSLFVLVSLMHGRTPAQDSPSATAQNPIPTSEVIPTVVGEPNRYRSITHHQLIVGEQDISYDAIAGETYLKDGAGNSIGSIFSFTYLRTDVENQDRPVLFIFNGGPGSASLWLHLGALGPKKLVLDREVNPSNIPPFELDNNENSPLDVADLVFIDPIGTGFSRPINGTDPKIFWGVDEDADSIAQFIELWLTEYGRWNSPKFVLGESYGSTRAAILPRFLMGSPFPPGVLRGISLNGIIMVGTTLGNPANVKTPEQVIKENALRIPGIAVTSAYHKLIPIQGNIENHFKQALEFSKTRYLSALQQLAEEKLSPAEETNILKELQTLTGLSAAQIGEDLVIDEKEYAKIALQKKGLELGIYDSRYTLPLANSGQNPVADDPAMTRYGPGFVAAFHELLESHLHVNLRRPYIAIRWKDLLPSWNWSRGFTPIPIQNSGQELAWAMRRNPDLRVLVASGYFDLATTAAAALDQFEAGGVPAERVTFKEYPSGHMVYLGGTEQVFADDLKIFLSEK